MCDYHIFSRTKLEKYVVKPADPSRSLLLRLLLLQYLCVMIHVRYTDLAFGAIFDGFCTRS